MVAVAKKADIPCAAYHKPLVGSKFDRLLRNYIELFESPAPGDDLV